MVRARLRGNGDGSVYRVETTGGPRWKMSVTQGGRRVYRTFAREADAKAALKLAQKAKDSGRPVAPKKHTMGELFDAWLAQLKEQTVPRRDGEKPERSYGTWRSYHSHVTQHIKPALGSIDCAKLSVKDVEDYLAGLSLSARTRQYHRSIIRRALNVGIRWEWLDRNVVEATEPMKLAKRRKPTISIADAEALLAALYNDSLYPMYQLALWAGLRAGEVAGVSWENVDLERGRLYVGKQVQRVDGRLQLVAPKTEASEDWVRLQSDVLEMLRERHAVARKPMAGLVFTTRSDQPYDPVYITHHFQAGLRKVGLPVIPFHYLRHYFVSFAPQLGTHVAVASKQARHASIKTTEDVYTGVLDEMTDEANTALERARENATAAFTAALPSGRRSSAA